MWIMFSTPTGGGFMSIVAKDQYHTPSGVSSDAIMCVRFRRAEDARHIFPGLDVEHTPRSDYGYRIHAPRHRVAEVVQGLVSTLNYDNFKSSLPSDDNLLHDVCHEVWEVVGELAPNGPYGWYERSGVIL